MVDKPMTRVCEACDAQASIDDPVCPNCGYADPEFAPAEAPWTERHGRWAAILVVVILVIAGVYALIAQSGDEEPVASSERQTVELSEDSLAEKRQNVYEIAFTVCKTFPPDEIARQYGTGSTDPLDLAEAYSHDWQVWAMQSAYKGCLAGLAAQGGP